MCLVSSHVLILMMFSRNAVFTHILYIFTARPSSMIAGMNVLCGTNCSPSVIFPIPLAADSLHFNVHST